VIYASCLSFSIEPPEQFVVRTRGFSGGEETGISSSALLSDFCRPNLSLRFGLFWLGWAKRDKSELTVLQFDFPA